MADDGLETSPASSCGACRQVAGGQAMTPHMRTALRDFARTGRVSKEALAEFIRQGWAYLDEYGSPHTTTHGENTLKNIERSAD